MIRKTVVRGVIYKDKQLFLVRNKDNNGNPQEWLNLVGGKLEEGEDLISGVKREIMEETGIAAQIGHLLYIQQFNEPEKDKEYLEFFFEVENVNDFDIKTLQNTSHGENELAEFGFFDNVSEVVLPTFLRERDILKDIEAGQTQIFNYIEKNETK